MKYIKINFGVLPEFDFACPNCNTMHELVLGKTKINKIYLLGFLPEFDSSIWIKILIELFNVM